MSYYVTIHDKIRSCFHYIESFERKKKHDKFISKCFYRYNLFFKNPQIDEENYYKRKIKEEKKYDKYFKYILNKYSKIVNISINVINQYSQDDKANVYLGGYDRKSFSEIIYSERLNSHILEDIIIYFIKLMEELQKSYPYGYYIRFSCDSLFYSLMLYNKTGSCIKYQTFLSMTEYAKLRTFLINQD